MTSKRPKPTAAMNNMLIKAAKFVEQHTELADAFIAPCQMQMREGGFIFGEVKAEGSVLVVRQSTHRKHFRYARWDIVGRLIEVLTERILSELQKHDAGNLSDFWLVPFRHEERIGFTAIVTY